MHPTTELLTSHGRRLGIVVVPLLALLGVAVVAALGLTVAFAGELFAAGSEPVQVAPFRWFSRA